MENNSLLIESDRNDVAAAKKIIATDGKTKFFHLMLYNSLVKTSSINEGMSDLLDMYSNLMVSQLNDVLLRIVATSH